MVYASTRRQSWSIGSVSLRFLATTLIGGWALVRWTSSVSVHTTLTLGAVVVVALFERSRFFTASTAPQ